MSTVITVENISKKYIISHQSQDGYGTLRDVITEKFRNVGRRLFHPFNGSTVSHSHSSTTEEFWALKDVSFEIKQGDRVGIIGRNGAGKSTLLKILSRITEPTTGKIRIKGRVASLLEVGTGFHPELTGRENIFLNGAILGMTKSEIHKKYDEIVAFAEIEKFLDTPVKRYSSGMYVRLAFAVAAHLEPEILLVDEVLAVGDAAFQKKCLGKMEDVSKEGRTVLFVSHNMAAMASLCQRGLLLSAGRVMFTGDMQEVITQYVSRNTAVSGGAVDLSERRQNRFGLQSHGSIRSLKLLDENGKPIEVLKMGQQAFFHVEIEFKRAGKDYEIGIGISNLQDILIHRLVSNWEGFQTIPEAGMKMIEVKWPAVHLYPGEYQVMIWEKKQNEHLADDIVREALRFSVEEARITPYYAYFTKYSQNTQVYTSSSWRLIK